MFCRWGAWWHSPRCSSARGRANYTCRVSATARACSLAIAAAHASTTGRCTTTSATSSTKSAASATWWLHLCNDHGSGCSRSFYSTTDGTVPSHAIRGRMASTRNAISDDDLASQCFLLLSPPLLPRGASARTRAGYLLHKHALEVLFLHTIVVGEKVWLLCHLRHCLHHHVV